MEQFILGLLVTIPARSLVSELLNHNDKLDQTLLKQYTKQRRIDALLAVDRNHNKLCDFDVTLSRI